VKSGGNGTAAAVFLALDRLPYAQESTRAMNLEFLPRGAGERLAFERLKGRGPEVVWLGGFNSDMTGTKAEALADWAAQTGRAYTRFDYFGHGASSGDFADGTITRWREDTLAVIDELTAGPLILVGSSMGAWLACLTALSRPDRIQGLILIAPAADFTSKLADPAIMSPALMEDGARWTIMDAEIPITAPVRILQGAQDESVPWRHALALAEAITTPDLIFTLIRNGDHRLSRPQDIARLIQAIEELE
jgi:pimeloyl-ACP methyl ester carboxylesterase